MQVLSDIVRWIRFSSQEWKLVNFAFIWKWIRKCRFDFRWKHSVLITWKSSAINSSCPFGVCDKIPLAYTDDAWPGFLCSSFSITIWRFWCVDPSFTSTNDLSFMIRCALIHPCRIVIVIECTQNIHSSVLLWPLFESAILLAFLIGHEFWYSYCNT